MLAKRLIKSNDAGGGACTNTVDLYNPFPDGGGVALYQLNGDATDESGNYDATTVTNITWGGAGEFGTSAAFNGSNSYIQASTSPLSGFSSTSNYSVSLWFKANSLSSISTLISGITGIDTLPPYIWVDSTKIKFHGYQIGEYTGTINTGQWYNVVMVNSGTTTKAYINGSEVTLSGLTNWNQTAGGILEIGGLQQYGEVLDGSIDQVRIFNRALRPYEVEALYTEEYCTPTIVPSEHFNTVLYTGTGATNPVTGVGFQPDFVWLKKRSGVDDHFAFDSVRGAKSIYPNLTNAEDSFTFSFDTDGFTVPVSGGTNGNGDTFVAWNFKAGGAAVTNTDGTITSQVSANTEAGFSVVSYTGNGTQPSTIGHGLNSAPKIVMNKCRSLGGTNWHVYSSDLGATSALVLNDTASAYTGVGEWGSDPSSSVLYVNNTNTNNSGRTYISYCFAEVEGFSNFGSYVGTGASNTIVTGFEPAFVMIKRTDASGYNWVMYDNKRSISNPIDDYLNPNTSDSETTNDSSVAINFLSNGFEIPSTSSWAGLNASGGSYIYMAFAADPTAVEPTLEDSFNTVLYSGNGGTQSITGVGFQPDFLWIKSRTSTLNHIVFDSVRGAGKVLYPNLTYVADDSGDYWLSSFDNNGFTVNVVGGGGTNQSGVNYVAWNWKGAEIPAINSNGSIPSVVSANPAAGFSIVSWTGNGVIGSTVGHGLTEVPEMIIVKNRTSGSAQWAVYHSAYGATKHTLLNTTDAASTTGDWNNTEPTNSVITFNNSLRTNASGNNYIAYVFHSVAGFSKFGFWQGGTTSIDLGFEPAFVLNQDYGAGGGWGMFDSVRGFDKVLAANSPNAEATSTFITPNATGFTVPSESSIVFRLYMAFANQF